MDDFNGGMAGFGYPGKDTTLGDICGDGSFGGGGARHFWASLVGVLAMLVVLAMMYKHGATVDRAWDKCVVSHYYTWCDAHPGDDGGKSTEDLR